jgi:hypothetical protein
MTPQTVRLSFSSHLAFWGLIRCYVIFPYVTIPNVTIPKVVKIPNIYTNPERNNPARGGEKGTKLGEGGRDSAR